MTTSRGARLSERYRTLAALGRGGMGSVEIALETAEAGFERIVALKRLLPDAKARHAEMFLREARLAVLLDHPNVVHAFDFGEIEGELFMAMEYVEGEPLSRVLVRAREENVSLDVAVVAKIVADVCEGLHAAHELRDESGHALRVVHRDVSPHNVMVSYDGHVKVVDFGVAKIDDANGYTRTGEVKGKAAYMSPEQAMGDPLDRRSDLYSVGAVLFECLTGRRMWEGTDMEVMRKLALSEPPDLPVTCDAEIVALYKRLTARDVAQRPNDAAEVARALRAFASRAGDDAVSVLMTRLFDARAKERKAELDRAIRGVDQAADVGELRKSLEPGAPRTGSMRAQAIVVPRRKRTGLVVAAGVVTVAGISLAVAASRATPPSPAGTLVTPTSNISVRSTTSAAPSTDMSTGPAAILVTPPPNTSVRSTAPAARSTDTSTGPAAILVPPTSGKRDAGRIVAGKADAGKPLDVDPNAL